MRMLFLIAAPLLLILAVGGRAAGQESDETPEPGTDEGLGFDQIFADDYPGAWPKQIRWSPDGAMLTYLLPDGERRALWAMSIPEGSPERLLAAADLPGDGSIDEYRFAPGGDELLITSGERLLTVSLDDGAVAQLGVEGEPEGSAAESAVFEEPTFSPDGRWLAFSRNADLWLLDRRTGKERALTVDGKPGETLNGTTDWVYWEEIWGRDSTAFWWSPDSRRIAFYRFDETPVKRYPLVDFLPTYPEVEWQAYPKAGEDNPVVKIGVVAVAAEASERPKRRRGKADPRQPPDVVWLDTGAETDVYLARVDWHPDGERVAVQRLNRDQNRLDLLLCDAASGACENLLTEESPTWIDLGREFRFLPDGRFLWGSDREGFRKLYLYSVDGELIRPLTPGALAVSSVDRVDAEAGKVIVTGFLGAGVAPAERHVFEVELATGQVRSLTQRSGWNGAEPSPSGEHWLHTISSWAQPPSRTVRSAAGETVATLPTGPEPAYDPATLPTWKIFLIWSLEGRQLPAAVLLPPDFDPDRKYPAIMYHYGCPASQVVANRWSGRGRDLWHRMMAQRGYVVLSVDNLTSTFYGKGGADKSHRDFGPYNLDAQLAGVEYLKTLDYVDAERIGIWGWSGGGSNTLGALLGAPGTWKAGVAGAPVTDWRLYDTIWTERYLDRPQDNPDGYRSSSPVHFADQLQDRLLIVHGTADDNVHPQNTIVMSHALIEAGKPFEQAIYPREKHGISGKAERHFYEKMTEFFDRHLKE